MAQVIKIEEILGALISRIEGERHPKVSGFYGFIYKIKRLVARVPQNRPIAE